MEDAAAFAKLVQALRPWLGHLVIVGGWAHQLYRLHPLAGHPDHAPLRTRDVDLALSLQAPVEGDLRKALERADFEREFFGEDSPPVTRYILGQEDGGFYAEFLAPLSGSGVKRDGSPDVTASKAGIIVQKLRHLDLLLLGPWSVRVGPDADTAFTEPIDLLVANPVAFIVQKLLIHDKRKGTKKAQDILYIHDTLELFGGHLDDLHRLWVDHARPALPKKTATTLQQTVRTLLGQVTDVHREAARIPQDRRLTPENLRATCEYGLAELFGGAT